MNKPQSASDWTMNVVAGTGAAGGIRRAKEIAVDPAGNILVVDTENNVTRRIDARIWIVTTVACSPVRPHGLAVAPDGPILVGDSERHQIRRFVRPR